MPDRRHRVDELGHELDRVDANLGMPGVRGRTDHVDFDFGSSSLAECKAQVGGLADQRDVRVDPIEGGRERGAFHRLLCDRAHDVNRAPWRVTGGEQSGHPVDDGGRGRFHVAHAKTVQPVSVHLRPERLVMPEALAVVGNRVDVAVRKDDR